MTDRSAYLRATPTFHRRTRGVVAAAAAAEVAAAIAGSTCPPMVAAVGKVTASTETDAARAVWEALPLLCLMASGTVNLDAAAVAAVGLGTCADVVGLTGGVAGAVEVAAAAALAGAVTGEKTIIKTTTTGTKNRGRTPTKSRLTTTRTTVTGTRSSRRRLHRGLADLPLEAGAVSGTMGGVECPRPSSFFRRNGTPMLAFTSLAAAAASAGVGGAGAAVEEAGAAVGEGAAAPVVITTVHTGTPCRRLRREWNGTGLTTNATMAESGVAGRPGISTEAAAAAAADFESGPRLMILRHARPRRGGRWAAARRPRVGVPLVGARARDPAVV